MLCAKAQLRNMRDEVKTRGGWQDPSSITWWLTAFLLTLSVYKREQDVKKWVSAFLGDLRKSLLGSELWGGARVSITSFLSLAGAQVALRWDLSTSLWAWHYCRMFRDQQPRKFGLCEHEEAWKMGFVGAREGQAWRRWGSEGFQARLLEWK